MTSHSILISKPVKSEYEAYRGHIDKDSIIVYKTGKIVYTNFPQLNRLIELSLRELPSTLEDHRKWTIGSDEAGKGEVLGPLVIASVVATKAQGEKLRLLGVKDSKQISQKKIIELIPKIEHIAEKTHFVLITPKRFTELHQQFLNEDKTLNDLLAWAHAKTISEIIKKMEKIENFKPKATRIVIDEFDKIATNQRLRRNLSFGQYEIIQKPRAESIIPVAAASVLARGRYLEWLSKHKTIKGKAVNSLSKQDITQLSPADRELLLKQTFKNA